MTDDQWRAGVHRLDQAIHTGLTRLLWLWGLGNVWLIALIAGAVVVRLWARS
jgi:hypothetical protein